MQVKKRDGSLEPVCFDKILHRISVLASDLPGANAVEVAKTTIAGLRNGISTSELDGLAASSCAALASYHPDFALLGGRVEASNIQKNCSPTFAGSMDRLRPSLVPSFSIFVDKHAAALNAMIRQERDLTFDFFGIATLKQGYLLRECDNKICETPQYLYLRIATALHYNLAESEDSVLRKIQDTYNLLSVGLYTHASPTMFNAGLRRNQQLASCFLLPVREDSLNGIFETVKDCAVISKHAGGIGLYIGNVRAAGSKIYGTGGKSDGVVPLCRILNETSRYANQSGRRKGAFAVYMPPWHKDIYEFLQLRQNTGAAENRARDLFTALMIPDLFMQRVKDDGDWALFCPTELSGLDECWGKLWESRYTHAEKTQQGQKVKARHLWSAILKSQIETGSPYLIFRDHANAKSNQQHSGTIKNSNLCAEIMQTSSSEETAVCNLASLCLPRFLTPDKKMVDIDLLHAVTRTAVRNLDRIIDITTYPVLEAKMSNFEHRPVGLGICGLADLFMILGLPFESPEAAALNERLSREIYYAALSASAELAREKGRYPAFEGSPASQSRLQPDLWGVERSTGRWVRLKADIKAHGLRNSLLIALMPTASTSQILGVCESFEPIYSNLMVRRTLAGEHAILNRHLVKALEQRALWTPAVREQLLRNDGSVQELSLPDDIKRLFKTVWEVPMKAQLQLSALRGPYVCQSQSLNVYLANATERKLSSSHFYAWESGLKTGCYYLRTKAATSANVSCNGDVCVMCTV